MLIQWEYVSLVVNNVSGECICVKFVFLLLNILGLFFFICFKQLEIDGSWNGIIFKWNFLIYIYMCLLCKILFRSVFLCTLLFRLWWFISATYDWAYVLYAFRTSVRPERLAAFGRTLMIMMWKVLQKEVMKIISKQYTL